MELRQACRGKEQAGRRSIGAFSLAGAERGRSGPIRRRGIEVAGCSRGVGGSGERTGEAGAGDGGEAGASVGGSGVCPAGIKKSEDQYEEGEQMLTNFHSTLLRCSWALRQRERGRKLSGKWCTTGCCLIGWGPAYLGLPTRWMRRARLWYLPVGMRRGACGPWCVCVCKCVSVCVCVCVCVCVLRALVEQVLLLQKSTSNSLPPCLPLSFFLSFRLSLSRALPRSLSLILALACSPPAPLLPSPLSHAGTTAAARAARTPRAHSASRPPTAAGCAANCDSGAAARAAAAAGEGGGCLRLAAAGAAWREQGCRHPVPHHRASARSAQDG